MVSVVSSCAFSFSSPVDKMGFTEEETSERSCEENNDFSCGQLNEGESGIRVKSWQMNFDKSSSNMGSKGGGI